MEDLKPHSDQGLTAPSKSELPDEFQKVMADIGGSDAKFVIQKRLSVADTCLPPCCLSIPLKAVKRNNFLTEQEEEYMDEGEIPVLCIDPSLNVREMALSRDFREEDIDVMISSQKNSQTAYKLTQNWHSVKERNGLKTGDLVKIWTFLIMEDDEDDDGFFKRGFALVKVEDAQPRPAPKNKPELKLNKDQKPKSKKEAKKKIRPRK